MVCEFDRVWKEVVVAKSRYYYCIWLGRLMKAKKTLRIVGVPAEIRYGYLKMRVRSLTAVPACLVRFST
jgi:hypothetical protein